jgi:magnesium transporter
MIRAFLYSRANKELITGNVELCSQWRQNPDTLLWLDLVDEDAVSEQQLLQQEFGLHPLAIQDAQRDRHPPKLEAFDNHTFLLLKELTAESTTVEFSTIQLALFIGERFLITRRTGKSASTDALFAQLSQNTGLFDQGTAAIAMRLCRLIISRYLKILLDLEPRLEEVEQEIMQHPHDAILAELLGYKSELKKFRRVFVYHEQLFREMTNKSFPALNGSITHQIVDVYEQQERVSSLTGLYYELASDLVDGYISIASHRLNQIMKVLTIVMAIFVPLSFLAGIYGMNFENMPELQSPSGYFILLGVMGSIAFALLAIFRSKRWI